MIQLNKKVLRSLLLLGIIVGAFFESQAQEVLTKTNGGASWQAPEYNEGIYTGDGTTPSDVDVTVTDNIDFDAGKLFIDGANDEVGVGTTSSTSTLDVNGSVSKPIVLQNSGSLVLNETHYTVVGQISFNGITLPASNTCDGRIYVIVNRGSSGISLNGSGVLVNQFFDIDGSVTTSIAARTSVTLQASLTGWFRIR